MCIVCLVTGCAKANPGGSISDISALAGICDEVGVPLIVDNTLATPALCRPIEHGASLVSAASQRVFFAHGCFLFLLFWLALFFPTLSLQTFGSQVVHSTTKFLSGHGNALGGVVIDSGKFNWATQTADGEPKCVFGTCMIRRRQR